MAWCLPPGKVDKFKNAILSGRIDPERLAEMTSAERRSLFEKELGTENAENINAQFESKLLLKNKQAGYVNWARKMLGENTPAGRDVISRIGRMEKELTPENEAAFLEDLVSKRLGAEVSYDEAKKIAELSGKIDETRAKLDEGGDRLEYGQALVNLKRYVGDLKTREQRLTVADFRQHPIRSVISTAWEGVKLSKALKAAWDNSAVYRPGNKVMMVAPKIWAKQALDSFKNIWRTYGGKQVLDIQEADILSRPNALNGYYKKSGLDIGVTEEAYPTDVPERAMEYVGGKIEQTKIPVVSKVAGRAIGKTYKASQDSYTAFTRGSRADLFDKYIDIANRTGVELDDVQLKAIGRMVNSLVARGRLGSLERAGQATNVAFFSPKMLKSHVDVLLEPLSGGGGGFTGFSAKEPGTAFVRKQAALNLLKIVGGTAAILTTAKALKDDSVDFDPRSANFGKIKIGDTRFDVTGGMSSLAVLAARLATGKTKSSITGEVRPFNERDKEGKVKFGAPTYKDAVYDFFENKLSPGASVVKDIAEGRTFQGEKPSAWTTFRDLYEPLPVSNYRELKNNPNSAPVLLAIIADGLGIATNTYGITPEQVKRMEDKRRHDYIEGLKQRSRAGEDLKDETKKLLDASAISPVERGEILRSHNQTELQSKFSDMELDKALDEYDKLNSTDKTSVQKILRSKALHALPRRTKNDRTVILDRLRTLGLIKQQVAQP